MLDGRLTPPPQHPTVCFSLGVCNSKQLPVSCSAPWVVLCVCVLRCRFVQSLWHHIPLAPSCFCKALWPCAMGLLKTKLVERPCCPQKHFLWVRRGPYERAAYVVDESWHVNVLCSVKSSLFLISLFCKCKSSYFLNSEVQESDSCLQKRL